jgi:hypothetical protein
MKWSIFLCAKWQSFQPQMCLVGVLLSTGTLPPTLQCFKEDCGLLSELDQKADRSLDLTLLGRGKYCALSGSAQQDLLELFVALLELFDFLVLTFTETQSKTSKLPRPSVTVAVRDPVELFILLTSDHVGASVSSHTFPSFI